MTSIHNITNYISKILADEAIFKGYSKDITALKDELQLFHSNKEAPNSILLLESKKKISSIKQNDCFHPLEILNRKSVSISMETVETKKNSNAIMSYYNETQPLASIKKHSQSSPKTKATMQIEANRPNPIPTIIVESKNQFVAIPQAQIEKLLQIKDKDLTLISNLTSYDPTYPYLGIDIPVINLNWLLNCPKKKHRPLFANEEREIVNLIIIKDKAHLLAIVVDSIIDAEDISINPLFSTLEKSEIFKVTTQLQNNRTALVLDIKSCFHRYGTKDLNQRLSSKIATRKKQHSYLLIKMNDSNTYAVPMSKVEKIISIEPSEIGSSTHKGNFKYKNISIPIILPPDFSIDHNLPILENIETLLLVINNNQNYFALYVTEALDIIEGSIIPSKKNKKDLLIRGEIEYEMKSIPILDIEKIN